MADYIIPNTSLSGVYHFIFTAYFQIRTAELNSQAIWQIHRSEPYYDTACDRSLNSQRLRSLINYSAPSWADMVAAMYQDHLDSPYYQHGRLNNVTG